MTTFDVETDEADEPRTDQHADHGRRRRALVAGLVVVVPVLAVVAVLGIRAADTTEEDLVAAEAAVSAAAEQRVAPGQGVGFGGGAAGPGEVLTGSSSVAPESGVLAVGVVCASVDAGPLHVTVRSLGETVAETAADCSDVADRDAPPAVTELPGVDITGRWSVEVTSETRAVVTVVAS